ncbi:MAG TPA: AMP-binding protein [Candidatus Bathyarchaeia archaeon]|nr:AMP-binding protein [Candidatus Bathyarchaeia archaeon]
MPDETSFEQILPSVMLRRYRIVRALSGILAKLFYRIRVVNAGAVPSSGGALLVCNHLTYLDAFLIVIVSPRPVRFLVDRAIYNKKLLTWFFHCFQVVPISPQDNPKLISRSLQEIRRTIEQGGCACMFAEGNVTRTGNTLRFQRGFEHVMAGLHASIIPVCLDGLWGSLFSFDRSKSPWKRPSGLRRPLTVVFGDPLPSDTRAFEVRHRVLELGAEAFVDRLTDYTSLVDAFFKRMKGRPFDFCMADGSGKNLNRMATGVAAAMLARRLKPMIREATYVGIYLPPSIAGALANIAVSLLHQIPVNLNHTASREFLVAALRRCDIRHVVTSRVFLEKAAFKPDGNLIFVEDLLRGISWWERIAMAAAFLFFPRSVLKRMIGGKKHWHREDLATIIFTSGSTGIPKGVMLTHANLLANCLGFQQIANARRSDKILGILPFFHSFGFTTTIWFPLIADLGVVYYPNPFHAQEIGRLVKKFRVTFMVTTPSFLNNYIQRCQLEDFASLRIIVTGAEKLRPVIARAFEEKFGKTLMEGYGCTEVSPVVSACFPDYHEGPVFQEAYKSGKIGRTIPGLAVKIIHVETGETLGPNQDGLLCVKGASVMKGYLNEPELTAQVIKEGWYVTGDIGNIDLDGFLQIKDRLSRFSKIGGEMVPHLAVEEKIHEIIQAQAQQCLVTAVPDDRKGEQLVVLYVGQMDVPFVTRSLRDAGFPNLWIPSAQAFLQIDEIPVLGTGKVNLLEARRLALKMMKRW